MSQLNNIPFAAVMGGAAAYSTGMSPLAGACFGVAFQRVLAPIVDPIIKTLENSSKTGGATITAGVSHLFDTATSIAAIPVYLALQPTGPFSIEKAAIAGLTACAVNFTVGRPVSRFVGSLITKPLEGLTTVTSVAFFAGKTFTAWKTTQYLSGLGLSETHMAAVAVTAITLNQVGAKYLFSAFTSKKPVIAPKEERIPTAEVLDSPLPVAKAEFAQTSVA